MSPLNLHNNSFLEAQTQHSITSDAVRYLWAGYFVFVLLSSLLGDTTILIASIKYRAIKLHKVIVVIIQHIAVCDLLISITDVFVKLVSVIAGEWVFGDFLCYFTSYSRYYFNPANLLLICTMTTSKLLTLTFPLRCGTVTRRATHKVCMACWVLTLCVPLALFMVERDNIRFDVIMLTCNYAFESDTWQWLAPLMTTLFLVFPICVVSVMTVYLLIIARKIASRGRKSLKWQGIMTTVATAAVYCISVLPLAVYRTGKPFLDGTDKNTNSFFITHFYRIAYSCVSFNTISNFYIYSLTVLSFRDFVRSRIKLSYDIILNANTNSMVHKHDAQGK